MKTIYGILFLTMVLGGLACTSSASGVKNKKDDPVHQKDKAAPKLMEPIGSQVPIPSPTATNESGSVNTQEFTPEALVKELYKQHDNENSPFFQTTKREYVEKFFVKSLATMIWKDSVNSEGEVGALDFDPLYNGQDFEISEFNVGNSEIKGEKASLKVDFLNFGEAQTITFKLAKEKTAWKIEDIDYGNFTLVGIFNENGK